MLHTAPDRKNLHERCTVHVSHSHVSRGRFLRPRTTVWLVVPAAGNDCERCQFDAAHRIDRTLYSYSASGVAVAFTQSAPISWNHISWSSKSSRGSRPLGRIGRPLAFQAVCV